MRMLACIVACGAISIGAQGANTVTTIMGARSPVTLSLSSDSATCAFTTTGLVDPNRFDPRLPTPQTVAAPEGTLPFRVEGCGAGQSVRVTAEFPYVLPSDAEW